MPAFKLRNYCERNEIDIDYVDTIDLRTSSRRSNMILVQNIGCDRCWAVHHQVASTLSFWKCYNVPDGRDTANQSCQSVQSQGYTSMRWTPVLQSFFQMSKRLMCIGFKLGNEPQTGNQSYKSTLRMSDNTKRCRVDEWIRMEPPPNSTPFNTRS
jgi:hypothetical protein